MIPAGIKIAGKGQRETFACNNTPTAALVTDSKELTCQKLCKSVHRADGDAQFFRDVLAPHTLRDHLADKVPAGL